MSVTIGIDPHKSTHTAVAVDRDENQIARLTLPPIVIRPTVCWRGLNRSTATGCGRSSPPPGSVGCSHNS